MRCSTFQTILIILMSLIFASVALAKVCIECHKKITPNIVSDWQLSKHNKNKIGCSECHGDRHKSVQDVEAILTVAGLYKDGILPKPKNYAYPFPDLLTFHDAPTVIEQKLFVMFLEHRMRAFQGTFHANPDYALWYGWSEMQRDLTEIKEMAAEMREKHKKKKVKNFSTLS